MMEVFETVAPWPLAWLFKTYLLVLRKKSKIHPLEFQLCHGDRLTTVFVSVENHINKTFGANGRLGMTTVSPASSKMSPWCCAVIGSQGVPLWSPYSWYARRVSQIWGGIQAGFWGWQQECLAHFCGFTTDGTNSTLPWALGCSFFSGCLVILLMAGDCLVGSFISWWSPAPAPARVGFASQGFYITLLKTYRNSEKDGPKPKKERIANWTNNFQVYTPC